MCVIVSYIYYYICPTLRQKKYYFLGGNANKCICICSMKYPLFQHDYIINYKTYFLTILLQQCFVKYFWNLTNTQKVFQFMGNMTKN